MVHTSHGPTSVFVCGDQEKPALVTYSDVALNYMSCFQGLFFFSEAASLLFHNFCIYHIDAPGHELGAAAISSDVAIPTVDERRSSNVMRFMQVMLVCLCAPVFKFQEAAHNKFHAISICLCYLSQVHIILQTSTSTNPVTNLGEHAGPNHESSHKCFIWMHKIAQEP
jgi:hypothetical protein